ncbi:two pore potassium channel protein sup-9 [Planococcus citri]|uniref:two pore potassium channel protein sup-9 n=1 Tax=Planococcus citri TaxID=170843 RepID=UPI0031F85185
MGSGAHSLNNLSSGDEHSSEESSSETSYSVTDPKKTVKRCCRKIVTFMCTQVGVGGLIVGYAVVGAFSFRHIEGSYQDPKIKQVISKMNESVEILWNITNEHNVLNESTWNKEVQEVLLDLQKNITGSVKDGYNGIPGAHMWSFPAALMFCLSVFTMIGYGNMIPHTETGKAATMVYAVFGIPLYILYFKNMGTVLAQAFRWTYTWIYRCSMEDSHPKISEKNDQAPKRIIVPSTACLWVLFAYVATGTAMFSSWQSWSVMDSAYFCVTSLCKIGIGDFTPDNLLVSEKGDPTRLVFTFVYLLFGMGIIAMCFDLMKEDVTAKAKNLKNDIIFCFEDIQSKAIDFYKRRNSLE